MIFSLLAAHSSKKERTGLILTTNSCKQVIQSEQRGKEEDGRALHADGVTPGSGRGAGCILSCRDFLFYIRSIWDAILGNIAYLNR